MAHAKNYETAPTFAKVIQRIYWLFFPDTVYYKFIITDSVVQTARGRPVSHGSQLMSIRSGQADWSDKKFLQVISAFHV